MDVRPWNAFKTILITTSTTKRLTLSKPILICDEEENKKENEKENENVAPQTADDDKFGLGASPQQAPLAPDECGVAHMERVAIWDTFFTGPLITTGQHSIVGF
jgi:hypothetical protein